MSDKPDKYETIYRAEPHALGEPYPEFVRFFANSIQAPIRVLDLGCGQGRDALFIARLGHQVLAVDNSVTGVSQLNADAKAENLPIEAIVGNLIDYFPTGFFGAVVLDRILHMLPEEQRLAVLDRVLGVVAARGHVLIADEKKNLPAMFGVFEADAQEWVEVFADKGFLFMQRKIDK